MSIDAKAEDKKLQQDLSLKSEINLYYDLHIPENTTGPSPLLIACHGYGESKRRMMRQASSSIAPDGFVTASLQGPHQHMRANDPTRFGFGWLTSFKPEESIAIHHKFVLDVIERLTNENVVDRSRIFLLGFSQSCALNFRFAFTYNEILRGVVGICGGIPGDWDTSEVYKQTNASVLYLQGVRDEFYTPEYVKDFASKLSQRASDVQTRSYDAPHEITPEMHEHIKTWLTERV